MNRRVGTLEAAFEAFMDFVQRQPVVPVPHHQYPEDPGTDWLQRVTGHNPPTYMGDEDPVILEGWIRDMDRIFEAVDCPLARQPTIAAFFLRDQADIWWVEYRNRDGPPMTWEMFKADLRTRFYPESLKRDKLREFMQLTQGSMTVRQYHSRFTELMRFAPGITANESTVVFQFEQGLNFGIRRMMGAVPFSNLATLYERACLASTLVQEQTTILGKRKPENHSPGVGIQPWAGRPTGPPPRDQSRGLEPQRGAPCRRCGRNHLGRNCDGRVMNCMNCGKTGHRTNMCWGPPRSQQYQPHDAPQGGALVPQPQAYQQHYQRAPAPAGATAREERGGPQRPRPYPQQGGQSGGHLNVISQAEADHQIDVITGMFTIYLCRYMSYLI